MPDLRSYLNLLEEKGEVLHIQEEVDPCFEVSAVTRLVAGRQGPALLFENVKGYPMPVLTNQLGTRQRIALVTGNAGLDTGDRQPVEPVIMETGPVQEKVLVEDIDILQNLPVLTYHERDVSPYLTQGIVFMKDLDSGRQTMGIHRIQVRGPKRLGVYLASRTSTEFYRRAEKKNMPLPVAIVVGVHPAILMASVAWYPFGDKLSLAGSYLGEPVRLVKSFSSSLEVPSEAMFVIEGEILPGVMEKDGPFGESSGVYVPDITNTIQVTAITMRREPIFSAFVPWSGEDGLVFSHAYGSFVVQELKRSFPAVIGQCFDFRCGGLLVVQIESMARTEVRRLLYHVLVNNPYVKQVVVVNGDVDIFDQQEVNWAILTRSQPDIDWLILPDIPGSPIDPSTRQGTGSKVGIDATYPPEKEEIFAKVAPPEQARARAKEILGKAGFNVG
ncbi:MAG: UbiD family decarboxylase [Thermincola sp.]|jgi:2,5-furandicarboxylate decarboxylase 1|nr:UbiD family decarboxylase [Thermincola sp.]MDT3703198.1 UbiD family decarboxylase [Thermincola sp.]